MTHRRLKGFTLIELLVVMAIIAVLAGLGVVALSSTRRAGEAKHVETLLAMLDGNLRSYQSRMGRGGGDFPPSTLDGFPGVGRNFNPENAGIEALIVCLNRRGVAGAIDFEAIKGFTLENFDRDRSETRVTNWEAKDLFELVDPWGMPLVYFHHRDYARTEGRALGLVTGLDGQTVRARPYRNPKTKSFYNMRSFQLICAGPDTTFNTDDDITNFEK